MRGMENYIKSSIPSPDLEQAFYENPDFLFAFSSLGKFAIIQARRGELIVPEHPDLEAVRRGAEESIPEVLPGKFPKHRLSSLGNGRDGDVALAIAVDVQSVRGLATSQRGRQGNVREDIAERWKVLQMAARAAA
jgi:hypothetical protein